MTGRAYRPIALALTLLTGAGAALADTVIAARTIPVRTVIAAGDIGVVDSVLPGALSEQSAAIGLEARVTIYEGRPIRPGDTGPPALVDRNEIVALLFDQGGLRILTEGRALDRSP